jgi:hypothetical protein
MGPGRRLLKVLFLLFVSSSFDFVESLHQPRLASEKAKRGCGGLPSPCTVNAGELPIDYTSFEPNDPRFLDMPHPTERGPDSVAYARHMQWKRQLSDRERKTDVRNAPVPPGSAYKLLLPIFAQDYCGSSVPSTIDTIELLVLLTI